MRKSTLSDVAQLTGLSITTISRVLNNKSDQFRISKATQDIVHRAVEELDYRPNVAAQNLRNNSMQTIALLVPRIDNPFFANIASSVIVEARKYAYPVMVIDTEESSAEEESAIATLLSRNVDGIIAAPSSDAPHLLNKVAQRVPVVLIDRYFENSEIPYVATDNYSGAFEATKMLIDHGHSNILCIQGAPLSVTSRNRVNGYRDALANAGLEHMISVRGAEYSIQNGYIETKMELLSGRPLTAVFALSSTILLGAMRAIQEHGLRVPEDISIISFDDNVFLDYLNPAITRVCQPTDHIAVAAVKLLMDAIQGQTNKQPSMLLPPTIAIRNSIHTLK